MRDLLLAKYTKTILPDREIGVYPRLVLKLSMSYPERGLCERYLEAIADNFGVEWSADGSSSSENGGVLDEKDLLHSAASSPVPSSASSSYSLPPVVPVNYSPAPASSAESPPPPPYSEMKPSAPLPMDYSKQQQQQRQQQTKPNLPDFDEFTRRFEALRKK